MGFLIIPSLHNHGERIVIDEISLEDAQDFVNDFTNRVKCSRKLKMADDDGENMVLYINHLGENAGYAYDNVQELAYSNNKGVRGERVVYFDGETDTVGVGTTVVYNQNWATLNFNDDSVLDFLAETKEEMEEEFV